MAPQGYPHPREDETRAPFTEILGTFGLECEMASGNLAPILHEKELAPSPHLHGYQCACSERDRYLVHPTSDCTAHGGEYVLGGSSGMLFGSDTALAATRAMEDAIMEGRAEVDEQVGMHTHVGFGKKDGTAMSTLEKRRLVKNYLALQDQILVLAAGAFNHVRSNGNTEPMLRLYGVEINATFWSTRVESQRFELPGRPTLNFHTGKGTVEFRVWNGTRAQWRMIVAGGVSTAMVEAACQERTVEGPDAMDLTEHLHGLLTPDVLVLIDRQRKAHAEFNHR